MINCANCGKPLDQWQPELRGGEWRVIYDPLNKTLKPYCSICDMDPLVGLLRRAEQIEAMRKLKNET